MENTSASDSRSLPRVRYRHCCIFVKLCCLLYATGVFLKPSFCVCYIGFFRSLPTDDLVDWNSGVSVCTSRTSFSDFYLIWCVGRPRPDMRTSMTSTRSKVKVKVTELLKLRKLYFSTSISFAVLAWSSKLMVGGDSMGPGLWPIGARF